MGARFRNALPSDLRRVGALARESLLAPGAAYATQAERSEIARQFKRHGCHHCGRRSNGAVADHMPPNKDAHGSAAERAARQRCARAVGHARRCLGAPAAPNR
jgi:hypothetical protein